ncbi:MAG: tape measure protein [Burkholderiales bacterium]|nr:tape measure protein [Phycisphaerae bacterium]
MMSISAGAIVGHLVLDKSKYSKPLGEAVAEGRTTSALLRESLSKPFAAAAAETEKFTRSMRNATIVGSVLGTAITGATGLAIQGLRSAVSGVGGLMANSVKIAAQFEQSAISFEVMIGSAERAKKLMKELQEFAASTPFELPDITAAARKLLAFGFSAGEVVNNLRQLGDISSGLEIPLGELADLYGKARVAGRLFAEDINQLTGRGVPITAEFAKQFGVAESQVRDLVAAGRIGFPQLQQAVRDLTSEGGRFNGMTKRQSESIGGLSSTMNDAWTDVQRGIGEALVKGADGQNLLKDITKEIEKIKPTAVEMGLSLADAFKNVLPYIKEVMTWAQSLLSMMGLIDKYRAAGSPVGQTDNSGLLAQIGSDEKGLEQLRKLFGANANAGNLGATAANAVQQTSSIQTAGLTNDSSLTTDARKATEDWNTKSDLFNREMATLEKMQAIVKAGGQVDAVEFERVKKRLAELMELQNRLQEISSRAASLAGASGIVPEEVKSSLSKINDEIRKRKAEATGVINELRAADKAAKSAATDRAAGTEDGAFTGPDNAPAASAGGSAPASSAAIGSVGESAANALSEINKWWREAEESALKAAGRIDELEKLRLDRWMADELLRVKTIEERYALNAAYQGRLTELEAEQSAGRNKKAEDDARDAVKAEEDLQAEASRRAEQVRDRLTSAAGNLAGLSAAQRKAGYDALGRAGRVIGMPSISAAAEPALAAAGLHRQQLAAEQPRPSRPDRLE